MNNLFLEAWDELQPEIALQKITHRPAMDEMLKEWGPMPPEALVLGKAQDGLPVLLNLHDPAPGPVLLVGDAGTNKTEFLHQLAFGLSKTHTPKDVQYGVITKFPDEWDGYKFANCVGVFPSYHQSSEDFILSLASWAHGNKTNKQSVLLLIDSLDLINEMNFDTRQNLQWLLLRGPSRRVWPVITLSTNKYTEVEQWLDAFTTLIFSRIENLQTASLFGISGSRIGNIPVGEFLIREGKEFLQFYIAEENNEY